MTHYTFSGPSQPQSHYSYAIFAASHFVAATIQRPCGVITASFHDHSTLPLPQSSVMPVFPLSSTHLCTHHPLRWLGKAAACPSVSVNGTSISICPIRSCLCLLDAICCQHILHHHRQARVEGRKEREENEKVMWLSKWREGRWHGKKGMSENKAKTAENCGPFLLCGGPCDLSIKVKTFGHLFCSSFQGNHSWNWSKMSENTLHRQLLGGTGAHFYFSLYLLWYSLRCNCTRDSCVDHCVTLGSFLLA